VVTSLTPLATKVLSRGGSLLQPEFHVLKQQQKFIVKQEFYAKVTNYK
jgi:hypothetical protein